MSHILRFHRLVAMMLVLVSLMTMVGAAPHVHHVHRHRGTVTRSDPALLTVGPAMMPAANASKGAGRPRFRSLVLLRRSSWTNHRPSTHSEPIRSGGGHDSGPPRSVRCLSVPFLDDRHVFDRDGLGDVTSVCPRGSRRGRPSRWARISRGRVHRREHLTGTRSGRYDQAHDLPRAIDEMPPIPPTSSVDERRLTRETGNGI